MIRLPILVTGVVMLCASTAVADEVIRTGSNETPPAPSAESAPVRQTDPASEAIGAWARGVLAGEPARETSQAATDRCDVASDRKPHGQVWGAIGTGGYRSAGGVVTQPVGKCASVTIMVDHSEGSFGRGAWRR